MLIHLNLHKATLDNFINGINLYNIITLNIFKFIIFAVKGIYILYEFQVTDISLDY